MNALVISNAFVGSYWLGGTSFGNGFFSPPTTLDMILMGIILAFSFGGYVTGEKGFKREGLKRGVLCGISTAAALLLCVYYAAPVALLFLVGIANLGYMSWALIQDNRSRKWETLEKVFMLVGTAVDPSNHDETRKMAIEDLADMSKGDVLGIISEYVGVKGNEMVRFALIDTLGGWNNMEKFPQAWQKRPLDGAEVNHILKVFTEHHEKFPEPLASGCPHFNWYRAVAALYRGSL